MELFCCSCLLCVVILITWMYFRTSKKQLNFEKCIFISGCDSGFGQKIALYLDKLGCTVFAGCLFPDGEGARILKDQASERLEVLPLDITDEKSVKNAVEFVKNALNQESLVLINNAGVCICGEFDWMTWKQCCRQLDINLYGTIRMTKMFLPLIRKCKGRIINITSINGKIAYPGISVYCATKFALEGFSDALRHELEKFDVKVIVIEPGDFARVTNIMANHQSNSEEMWNEMDRDSKELYEEYFQEYQDFVSKNSGMASPKNIESSFLLQTINEAVFASSPLPRYLVASTYAKIVYKIFYLLPTSWSDGLVQFILKKSFKLELHNN